MNAKQLGPFKLNKFAQESIQNFLKEHPEGWEEVYFSKQLVQMLIDAINKVNLQEINRCLDKDKRLLTYSLKEESIATRYLLIDLVCNQNNVEVFKVVIERLKREKLFPPSSESMPKYLKLCTKMMGISGLQVFTQACEWKAQDYDHYLMKCMQNDEVEQLQILSFFPVDWNMVNSDRNGLLHLAAENGQREVAEFLMLSQKLSNKKLNLKGEKPSDLAENNGHNQLAQEIKQWHQKQKFLFLLAPLEETNKKLSMENEKYRLEFSQLKKELQETTSPLKQENIKLKTELDTL